MVLVTSGTLPSCYQVNYSGAPAAQRATRAELHKHRNWKLYMEIGKTDGQLFILNGVLRHADLVNIEVYSPLLRNLHGLQ